jgi:hypothetical protein
MLNKYVLRGFDIETINYKEKMIPYCLSYVCENDKKTFYGTSCVNDFIDQIFNSLKESKLKNKKIYIFSHNLTFDGSIIIQNIKSNEIKFSGLFAKGSIYNISLYKKNYGKIILKCTFKFFPTSLENAHNLLSVDKKIEFNHKNLKINDLPKIKEKAIEYCLNDSILVLQLLKAYNSVFTDYIPNWIDECNSMPSTALKIFYKKFNNLKINTSLSSKSDELVREGYYGGRCEVFGNPYPLENLYHYDFSGMYAQVMHEEFWFGNYIISEDCKDTNRAGFYYIEFYSNQLIPVLPEKCQFTKKLCFKSGHGSGLHWWEEINKFIEKKGIIKKIKYGILLEKNGTPFKDFVSHFTKKRKNGKNENTICKLITNSVYGRLGMAKIEDKTTILNKKDYSLFRKKNEKKIIKEIKVGEVYIVQYSIPSKTEINSNVFLAAIITSKARIKLYKGFEEVEKSGGRILYCDTDSIFAAYNKNVDNRKFGEIHWDVSKNDTMISDAVFAMPKAYAIKYKNSIELTRIKGIGKNKIKFKDFKKTFISRIGTKKKIEIIKKNDYIVKPSDMVKIIDLNKYDKRIFVNGFKETIPLGGGMNDFNYLKILEKRKDIVNPFNNPNYSIEIKKCKNKEKSREILGCWVESNKRSIKIYLNDDKIVEATEIISFIINNEAVVYNHLFNNSKDSILRYFLSKNALILDIELEAYGDNTGKSLENIDFIEHVSKTSEQ